MVLCNRCGLEEADTDGLCCRCLVETCEHEWTGQQLGGPPDMAESTEWVGYCKKCGTEGPED